MINSISAQNWQGYGQGFDHEIRTFYVDTVDNLLYIGGGFGYADTTMARGIATWDGNSFSGVGTCQFDWDCVSTLLPNEWPNPVLGITRYNDTIYAAGFFFTAGSTLLYGNAKFDGTVWQPVCSNPNTTVVRHFIDSNDDLYFMGLFDTICGNLATGIAKYDGNSVTSIGSNLDYLMEAIEYNGDIYFGGNFDNINGLSSIARYDGSNFFPVDGGFVGGFSWVSDLEIYKDELYVCGAFYKGAGNAADNIAKWDTTTSSWVDVGGGILETPTSPSGAAANKMTVFNGELWVVGDFEYAGGVPAQNIAKWNGTQWCGVGSVFDNGLSDVAVYNNELYISGGFWTIDGDTVNRFAKWIGGNFVDTCGSIVGINEFQQTNSLTLYPNPTNNNITIKLNEEFYHKDISIEIYDIIGQLSYSNIFKKHGNNHLTINVTHLPKGIYLVKLQMEEKVYSDKFVKQ